MKVFFVAGETDIVNWRTFFRQYKAMFGAFAHVVYFSDRSSDDAHYREIRDELKTQVEISGARYTEVASYERSRLQDIVASKVQFEHHHGRIQYTNVFVLIDLWQYDQQLVDSLIEARANVGIVLSMKDFHHAGDVQQIQHMSQLPFQLKSAAVDASGQHYLRTYEATIDMLDMK